MATTFSRLDMYFGGNNHGCQEYSKNVYKYTQADRLNALFTDNINLIALKMAGKFRCVSFLVNNSIQYFPCAFDVPFCIR